MQNRRIRESVRMGPLVLMVIGFCAIRPTANAATLKDISGEYFFGDGLGVNCTLKVYPTGKFSFVWTGCLGTYGQNEGKAALRDGGLQLIAEKPNVAGGFGGTPTNFFTIRWQGRMYLVHDIVEFCGEINQGQEPRRGRRGFYYLREKDWEKPVTGMPEVPEAFSRYILKEPAKGKILEIINEDEAWVDLGAEQGLLPSMTLTARPSFTQLRVETVEPRRCRVSCKYRHDKLIKGEAVSSRFAD